MGSKVKMKYNSRIAKILNVRGIVIYPFVLFASATPDEFLLNHELIHLKQIKQHGVLKFYLLYLKEYSQHRLAGKSHDAAYRSISFEKEAYENQHNLQYLSYFEDSSLSNAAKLRR